MAVRIRAFRDDDFSQLAAILGVVWHEHDDEATTYWRGADELAWHLRRTQVGFVACEDDAVVGTCLMTMADAPINPRWEAEEQHIIQVAKDQDGVDACSEAGLEAFDAEGALEEQVAEELGLSDVGILELIIVDPPYQRQGIGKRLLSEGVRWLVLQGADVMRLITDVGCDWQLYEHLGMDRVGESDSLGYGIFAYQGPVSDLRIRLGI